MHICDLCILASELDYDIRLGVIFLYSLGLGHYFLDELESEPVSDRKSARTRDRY